MVRKSWRVGALSVLVLLGIAGCSGSEADPFPSSTAVLTPVPSATADPGEQAIAAYTTYTRVRDEAAEQGRLNAATREQLELVATSNVVELAESGIAAITARGHTATGYTKVAPQVVAVEEQGTVVDLKDCIDVRGIKVVDASGKDTRLKGSPVRIPVEAEVTFSPSGGGESRWLVSEVRYDFRGTKCA